jgi:hypothetical protein
MDVILLAILFISFSLLKAKKENVSMLNPQNDLICGNLAFAAMTLNLFLK